MANALGTVLMGALLLAFGNGCASGLGQARADYSEGRFPEALAELRSIEHEYRDETDSARYALYRGLAHLALGEAQASHQWLDRCRALHAVDPNLLSDQELGSLRSAWRSLGKTPEDTVGFERDRALD